MKENLKKCIDMIYINKNYEYFFNKSKCKLTFISSLIESAQSYCRNIEYFEEGINPSLEIYFYYDLFREGELEIEYFTLLKISKVANLYSFEHEFCINNPDPNRMTPVLDGFGDQAYTQTQKELEDLVSKILQDIGFNKILLSELDEVVCEIELPDKNIFGSQLTVENALFRDLFNICE